MADSGQRSTSTAVVVVAAAAASIAGVLAVQQLLENQRRRSERDASTSGRPPETPRNIEAPLTSWSWFSLGRGSSLESNSRQTSPSASRPWPSPSNAGTHDSAATLYSGGNVVLGERAGSGSTTVLTKTNSAGSDASQRSRGSTEGEGKLSEWGLRSHDIQFCQNEDGSLVVLGEGAFGKVYKAMKGEQVVAVKVFGVVGAAVQQKEVEVLRSCTGANVVQFVGALWEDGQTMLVTEFMEGGDLFTALRLDKGMNILWYKRSSGTWPPQPGHGRQIALDVARGLHYLHSRRIVHLDMKSPNVLLTADHTAKVADVGLAKFLHKDYITSVQNMGTFAWSAPEVLMGERCTEKVDIYSYGVLLWEIVTGSVPTRGCMRAVRVPDECPMAVAELIERCMVARPAERPGADEIVDVLSLPDEELHKHLVLKRDSYSLQLAHKFDSPGAADLLEALLLYVSCIRGPADLPSYPHIRSATKAEEIGWYMEYLAAFKELIASSDIEDQESPERKRLDELIFTLRTTNRSIATHDPQAHRNFQATNLQAVHEGTTTTTKPSNPGTIDWRPVLGAIQFSEEEKSRLVQARSDAMAKLASISAERKELMMALNTFGGDDCGGSYRGAGGYANALDTSDRLRVNLAEENDLLVKFYRTFYDEVMGTVREAHVRLASWPLIPDPHALVGLLAADAGAT